MPDVDTIINGHWESLLTWNDLIDYRGFYTHLVDHAKAGISAGQSVEETVGSYKTPEQYGDYTAAPGYVETIVGYVYQGI